MGTEGGENEMIYFGHLSTKWILAYPTSTLVVDIAIGVLFVGSIVWILIGSADKEERMKVEDGGNGPK